jgi:hypothetical protein
MHGEIRAVSMTIASGVERGENTAVVNSPWKKVLAGEGGSDKRSSLFIGAQHGRSGHSWSG